MTRFEVEGLIHIPLFAQIAQDLRQGRSPLYLALAPVEIEEVMAATVIQLIQSRPDVQVQISSLEHRIVESRDGKHRQAGMTTSQLRLLAPYQADLAVRCVLGNHPKDLAKLVLDDINVGVRADVATAAKFYGYDLEGRAKNILGDPGRALFDGFNGQLEPLGVVLDLPPGLQYTPTHLLVALSGGPIS